MTHRAAVEVGTNAPPPAPVLDETSAQWLLALRSTGAERERAVSELHALLLRAARFETGRRASAALSPSERNDLAVQAADDALMLVLGKLDVRGAQPLHDLGVQVRRLRGRREDA